VTVTACRAARRHPRGVPRCPHCAATLAGLVAEGSPRGPGIRCWRCSRFVLLAPDPADPLRVVTVAEAVELARFTAEAEAVEALPVPVPAGRGPPARCSATKDPCESANRNRNQTIATRKGKPNMTDTREKAPKRLPARGSLSIFPEDHKRSTTPAQAYLMTHPLCASSGAAGPNKVACRALAIG
jgi:hypothetical protein